MTSLFSRLAMLAAVVAAGFVLATPDIADAKLSKGGGFGSRGSKSQMAPPVTQTAPRTASPIQNSGAPRVGSPASQGAMAANATRPGMFGSMSKGGFMAGLLGAGALGLLLGYGLSGGLGGFGAMLGLMLQILLFAGLAMLLFSWWQRRKQQQEPGYARGPYGQPHDAPRGPPQGGPIQGGSIQAGMSGNQAPRTGSGLGAMGLGGAAGGMFGGGQPTEQPSVPTRPLTLSGEDFSAFEKLLADVHDAYAREDQSALRQLCTDEMADYFAQDIAENVRENRAVRIANVKLEQGDLSEAWKEPGAEYATVAMRFSLDDQLIDRRTKQVLPDSNQGRSEITEIWTFVRLPGGRQQDWRLSAVQDVA